MALIVRPADLEQEIPLVRGMLIGAGLPGALGNLAPGPYGLTRTHLAVLDILERAGAIVLEMEKRLRMRITADRGGDAAMAGFDFVAELQPVDRAFCAWYAVFSGADYAAAACLEHTNVAVQVKGGFTGRWVQDLSTMAGNTLLQVLLREFKMFLEHHRSHPDPSRRLTEPERVADCAAAFFQLLANGIRQLASDSEYERHLQVVSAMKVEILGRRYQGFTATAAVETRESSDLLPVMPDDVVGNQEFLTAGMKIARDVAGFDFATGKNPKKINPILFCQGAPGCGKTLTAHAVGNYFLKYCRDRDIPARFLVIRRTDWASSYQNASASKLISIFKDDVYAFPGVVGCYWADIDTAFAARSDPGLRSEEKNILGASFGIFDGTLIPKNGKWFLLCDANYINMDQATLSRISQDPYIVKGPVTPEDFILLTRDKKLKDFADFFRLSQEDWQKLGQACV
ncbi:MAG: AAA family ATPase, partial [Candidatus Eremiobacterota bacterium]